VFYIPFFLYRMGLIELIQKDIQKITSNSKEFGVTLTLKAPTYEIAVIKGLHTKHHLGVDTEGNTVNSKNARASFSEKFLIDAGYPVRNKAGEVDFKNHLLSAADSTGVVKQYIIQQWFPDETIGLIVCILEDFE
jgi:hypothetical protein